MKRRNEFLPRDLFLENTNQSFCHEAWRWWNHVFRRKWRSIFYLLLFVFLSSIFIFTFSTVPFAKSSPLVSPNLAAAIPTNSVHLELSSPLLSARHFAPPQHDIHTYTPASFVPACTHSHPWLNTRYQSLASHTRQLFDFTSRHRKSSSARIPRSRTTVLTPGFRHVRSRSRVISGYSGAQVRQIVQSKWSIASDRFSSTRLN